MKAMILAAGLGKRMMSLTENNAKCLLKVGDNMLIEHLLLRLRAAGFHDIVINVAAKADLIKAALGNGSHYGVKIQYSFEQELLETGGGIKYALPLLGEQPFLVVNADLWTDFPYEKLRKPLDHLAHLVMVDTPLFAGDFGLHNNQISNTTPRKFTFAGISVLQPQLFLFCDKQKFKLSEVLQPAIAQGQVSGELYQGFWRNINTPDDLEALK